MVQRSAVSDLTIPIVAMWSFVLDMASNPFLTLLTFCFREVYDGSDSNLTPKVTDPGFTRQDVKLRIWCHGQVTGLTDTDWGRGVVCLGLGKSGSTSNKEACLFGLEEGPLTLNHMVHIGLGIHVTEAYVQQWSFPRSLEQITNSGTSARKSHVLWRAWWRVICLFLKGFGQARCLKKAPTPWRIIWGSCFILLQTTVHIIVQRFSMRLCFFNIHQYSSYDLDLLYIYIKYMCVCHIFFPKRHLTLLRVASFLAFSGTWVGECQGESIFNQGWGGSTWWVDKNPTNLGFHGCFQK